MTHIDRPLVYVATRFLATRPGEGVRNERATVALTDAVLEAGADPYTPVVPYFWADPDRVPRPWIAFCERMILRCDVLVTWDGPSCDEFGVAPSAFDPILTRLIKLASSLGLTVLTLRRGGAHRELTECVNRWKAVQP